MLAGSSFKSLLPAKLLFLCGGTGGGAGEAPHAQERRTMEETGYTHN